MNNQKFYLSKTFWLATSIVLIAAALLAALDGSGAWWRGLIAYFILLALGCLGLFALWQLHPEPTQANCIRSAVNASLLAFALRLAVGAALFTLLPIFGYPNSPEHQAGYAFTDAYQRDQQAWELAASNQPLVQAFSGRFSGDQYGGMLALSAFIYRYLSPDAHRPLLIVALGAAAAAWGVALLWKASQLWFGESIAHLAAWIFALYPESVWLGSSQMREPFVLFAAAMAWYGLSRLRPQNPAWLGWLAPAGLILFLLQPLAGFVTFGVILILWILETSRQDGQKQPQTLLRLILAGSVLLIAFIFVASALSSLPSLQGAGPLRVLTRWLQHNFEYQSYVMERASGMLQKLLDTVGERWKWLVILVYGIAQPVLPAVVGDPQAAPLLRLIGFLRAAGWYALAPFLVYSVMGLLRAHHEPRRHQLLWLCAATWGWIAIAALNAGGDQWDNPRYRLILLAWQALLAAWAWRWARLRRDAWLWRWIAVEVIFVLMFTEWYLGRVYPAVPHLDIRLMIVATLALAALILGVGWVWDRRKKKLTQTQDS